MSVYSTKEELVNAWEFHHGQGLHKSFCQAKAVYVPHLYRGGYVIRGFGYSTERIGSFVTKENAGNPYLV